MRIIEELKTAYEESRLNGTYTFIIFSSALIFGVFLWRQRLLLPLHFSLNIFGNTLGSHIFFYLLSFLEVPLYTFGFIFLLFRVSYWLSRKSSVGLQEILKLLSLNCLWFYLLPINYYLTKGYTQGYPNPLIGNSPNPYSSQAPLVFPLDFTGVFIWFLFFCVVSIILIWKGIQSLSDERIFNYLAVFLGGFALSIFLSFVIKDGGGDFYFFWYFLVILGVWFLYDYLSGILASKFKIQLAQYETFLSMFFLLLILLPLWYRFFASFNLNIYFYLIMLLLAAWITIYFIKNIRSQKLVGSLKFLIFYFALPILIFIFFFYPRLESTITPQHTAHTFYISYDSLENGRLLYKDYPFIYRGFLVDTGFVSFFKLFGISLYKGRLLLRFMEPFLVIIFYFAILKLLPWYFTLLSISLIRTSYLWLNFTAYNADWSTHIRYIYPDLLILSLILFFQSRKRPFLYFVFIFLPLTLLNSPDLGYSLIPAVACTFWLYFVLEKKSLPSGKVNLEADDKLYLSIFFLSLLAFWHLIFSLLSCTKFILLDYIFMVCFLGLCISGFISYSRKGEIYNFMNTPIRIIITGLSLSTLPFLYYLLRIKSLGKFLYLILKMPFLQLGVTSMAQVYFSQDLVYQPPTSSGDIGYFMMWHLPVLICYVSIIFIIHLFFIKKEQGRSVFYVLVFLTLSSLIMYMRTMALPGHLKVIYSMHFFWFLLPVLLFYLWRLFDTKRIILYSLLLINFIPTLPLFSSKYLNESNLFLHHNNFYITTLDAELKYLFQRNIDRDYLSDKFNGYFGSLSWFRDSEEDLYRDVWAEEATRIFRKNFGLEKPQDIDNTIWPRKDWLISMGLEQFRHLSGRTVSFGWWLRVEDPNRVRVFISDDIDSLAFSSFHSGKNDWEFLTVTKRIKNNARFLRVGMQIKRGPVVFKEENGPDAMRIGPSSITEGEQISPPKLDYTANMLHILWKKVFGQEIESYLE